MSTDREKLLGDASSRQTYGTTPDDILSTQRQTLRQQDQALHHLSGAVGSVRNIAGMIHSEVASQSVVLDGLNGHMSEATRDIHDASNKTAGLGTSTFNFRMFCILLWPLVLLIVLLVEAIVHFIF